MIAANATNDQFLGTFQLALMMKAENENSLSEGLISYCDQLLKQIKTLIDGKMAENDDLLPEAVKLALKIHHTDRLTNSFSRFSDFNNISKDDAIALLDALRDHAN
jgi:hypothetical protein